MKKNRYKIGVVGLGFVGLPLACSFINSGHEVYGIDVDERKIHMLENRQSYLSDFTPTDTHNLFTENRFHVGTSFEVATLLDVIIICIPTPLDENDQPDLQYLVSAAQNLVPFLRRGQLVVLESSTFPGTSEEILKPILETSGLTVGQDISLAYSPERIDPGSQWKLEAIPKVVGGFSPSCRAYAEAVYGTVFQQVVPVSSLRTAEMTKLLENCQRFVNISFMNSLVTLAQKMDISLWEAIEAAGTKPYGFTKYYPGPGVGGHCIPVDPLYLYWKAKELNIELPFIELSSRVNKGMPAYIVERLETSLRPKKLNESSVFVIGVTYKKDVDDVRESAAVQVIEELLRCGVAVSYFDPYVSELQVGETCLEARPITEQTLKQFDCTVILTDHSSIPYETVVTGAPLVFDTRNAAANLKVHKNIIVL